MNKSESAEIFWESIGPSGRSFYNNEYIHTQWQDIPLPVRKELSREMNYQQGRVNNVRRYGIYMHGKTYTNKISSNLASLILGLVAGAGGIIAGSALRNHLIKRGIASNRADPAIQEALNTTYRIHDSNRRLVQKSNYLTFITIRDIDSNMSLLAKDNLFNQQFNVNDEVSFGAESGRIVKLSKSYATILKSDGKTDLIHLRALIKNKDLIYTSSTGMTTWDLISQNERIDILSKCKIPSSLILKNWSDLNQTVKSSIQKLYGTPREHITKEDYECTECGDKFGDKDEYDDHMQRHKNKSVSKYHYHRVGRDREKVMTDDEKSDLRTDTTVGVQNEESQPKEKLVGALVGGLARGIASTAGGSDDDEDKSKESIATTGTGGMSNPTFSDRKKPKLTESRSKSEPITINGITQIRGKAQCSNCQCIIKSGQDKCPECNAQITKMREKTDLTMVAREANESFMPDEDDPDKPKDTPKQDTPKTTKKPVGSPNTEPVSTQRYEA